MGAAVEVIEWGAERARTTDWRGRRDIAYLAPLPGSPAVSRAFVERCVDDLHARGYVEVVTGALACDEQLGFLDAGFEVRAHLELLEAPLDDVPRATPEPGVVLRRARRADRADVLRVDGRAFAPFWRLDDGGLEEAVAATPASRFRLAVADGRVAAFAICGRAGTRGYVQRLAVDPALQRRGVGRSLLLDGLRWLRRWGASRAVVNTQPDNGAALALYEAVGFRRQPGGLDVLGRRLT